MAHFLRVRAALLAILLVTAGAAADAPTGPVDVPDEAGLGERLALIAWLRERHEAISDPDDLGALRAAYLRMTHPPQRAPVPAATADADQIDALKTRLWVRHRRNIAGSPPIAELEALLARLDKEAEAAAAAQQAEYDAAAARRAAAEAATAAEARQAEEGRRAHGQEGKTPTAKAPAAATRPTSAAVEPEEPEPPADSWRTAHSETGATYRLIYNEVVAPLRARPLPRPAWYAAANRYMMDSIAYAVDPIMAHCTPHAHPQLKALEQAGCDDTGVRAIACIFQNTYVDDPDPLMAALVRGGYSLRLQHACAMQFADYANTGESGAKRLLYQRYTALARDLGIRLMHSDLSDPRLKSLVARQLRANNRNIFYPEPASVALMTAFAEEAEHCEGLPTAVDPWLAAMVRGQLELMLAWKERGNGNGQQVTEAGWEGFARHQAEARRLFEQAWALDPSQPYAATMRIAVAMGMEEGSQAILGWLDRAVKACPDHTPAYDMALLALSPQWGGSPRLQAEVALRAMRSGEFTSPAAYAGFDCLHAPDVKVPWEDAFRVLRGYVDSPAYREVRVGNLHNLVFQAYLFHRNDAVVAGISELGTALDTRRFETDAPHIMAIWQQAQAAPAQP